MVHGAGGGGHTCVVCVDRRLETDRQLTVRVRVTRRDVSAFSDDRLSSQNLEVSQNQLAASHSLVPVGRGSVTRSWRRLPDRREICHSHPSEMSQLAHEVLSDRRYPNTPITTTQGNRDHPPPQKTLRVNYTPWLLFRRRSCRSRCRLRMYLYSDGVDGCM